MVDLISFWGILLLQVKIQYQQLIPKEYLIGLSEFMKLVMEILIWLHIFFEDVLVDDVDKLRAESPHQPVSSRLLDRLPADALSRVRDLGDTVQRGDGPKRSGFALRTASPASAARSD